MLIINWLLKIFSLLVIISATHVLNPRLFAPATVLVTTVIALSLVDIFSDISIMPLVGSLPSLTIELLLNALVLWLVPSLWRGELIPLNTTILITTVIAVPEVFLHRLASRSEKV